MKSNMELENIVYSSIQNVNVLYWACQAYTFNGHDVLKLWESVLIAHYAFLLAALCQVHPGLGVIIPPGLVAGLGGKSLIPVSKSLLALSSWQCSLSEAMLSLVCARTLKEKPLPHF